MDGGHDLQSDLPPPFSHRFRPSPGLCDDCCKQQDDEEGRESCTDLLALQTCPLSESERGPDEAEDAERTCAAGPAEMGVTSDTAC